MTDAQASLVTEDDVRSEAAALLRATEEAADRDAVSRCRTRLGGLRDAYRRQASLFAPRSSPP